MLVNLARGSPEVVELDRSTFKVTLKVDLSASGRGAVDVSWNSEDDQCFHSWKYLPQVGTTIVSTCGSNLLKLATPLKQLKQVTSVSK